ncbi:MAG TPA: zf-HC2 domain-containing protein [Bacteroidales bacterium]|nr:zf-HC2 domain-containing protein [Bacteroidales bacterium]
MNKNDNIMNCSHCRNIIDDYLEDRLTERERSSFQEHINSCNECSELLKIQELSDRAINAEKNITPGFFLTDRIMSKIESIEDQKEPAIIRILKPALLTVSVAAAIFAGVIIGKIPGSPSGYKVPVELTLINDNEIEFLDVLTID